MSAVDVIDRYLSDANAIREARERGQLGQLEADTWIERLDDALFHNPTVLAELNHELERALEGVEGHVLIGSRDAEHPGYSVRV
jgi:hypothetical protein